ncbi:hypothetical protein [Mycolicibacterium sphagni]|uniref:Uncharacterized protein n=1 Tax=Mycolicibacterium sphagni TaxID=1786 RepID=A0ABX2JM17_9MYCO|nr:hypothetical protein [Mycolicibacterium sphagni]NTY58734.1 hypothetical protein [Mycolicibacterium sphagni]
MGLWNTYRGFGGFWQFCLALSFVAGLGAAGLGIWGEYTEASFMPSWWNRMPYGVNIASSLTAFMVGVPVASVVLETMTSNRIEKAQKESVNRVSKEAWSNFTKAIHELCSEERKDAISSTAKMVEGEHDLIVNEFRRCRLEISNKPVPQSILGEIEKLRIFLLHHVPILAQRCEAVNEQFGREHQIRPKWNYILSLWQVLDTHVRLRRMEFQLDPMDEDTYSRILNDLMSDENPLFEFLTLHSGYGVQDGAVTSMMGLHALLNAAMMMPDDELFRFIKHWDDRLMGYYPAALHTSVFLMGLRMNVDSVTRDGWPDKVKSPRPAIRTSSATTNESAS